MHTSSNLFSPFPFLYSHFSCRRCAHENHISSDHPPHNSLLEDGIPGLTTEGAIAHNKAAYEIFMELVEGCYEGTKSNLNIRRAGINVGKVHKAFFATANFDPELAICAYVFDLIEGMTGTCNYKEYKKAYANVAALLMKGFARGVRDPDINILQCKHGIDGGKRFGKEYSEYLSSPVKKLVN